MQLQLSRGADINARNEQGETFLFLAVNRDWPYNEPHFRSLRQAVVALIESTLLCVTNDYRHHHQLNHQLTEPPTTGRDPGGADPGQCRVDGRGPVTEVGVDPTDTMGWEWIAFLRSVGIPVQTAADDDEAAAAAAGSDDATGAEADEGGEGRAEALSHRLRNDDDGDNANEDEEQEEEEEDSRSKGKEKLAK
jgi:hypothetical protein